ncbi:MAG TPA: hypothetical protein VFP65_06835 [Anaeromyxobacteraceae bacterium]|nr:hypothetical protein [Anaeromyxobacteraceae bacterium]
MHRRALALAAALLALAPGACARRDAAPDVAYRAFARAVSERDGERAWSMLSADTQAWLEARARAAAQAAPGVVPPSARQLLIGDAALAARPLASALTLRESADRAVVEVTLQGGEKREAELVREGGSWRVRLPEPR